MVLYGLVLSPTDLYGPVWSCFVFYGLTWEIRQLREPTWDSIRKLEKNKKALNSTLYHDIAKYDTRYLMLDSMIFHKIAIDIVHLAISCTHQSTWPIEIPVDMYKSMQLFVMTFLLAFSINDFQVMKSIKNEIVRILYQPFWFQPLEDIHWASSSDSRTYHSAH